MDMKNSDTLSEISESGSATSGFNSNWGSREELRDFYVKHGLRDMSGLYQLRFRVDRSKMEQMLTGDDKYVPADLFFNKIMEDTNTFIVWPNKMKLGAKSKKDPYVRIAGKQEDVKLAKEQILTVLYTKYNRVTMKMDISYTDHSHIIGKGGLSIKRVMEETQCHVHFPDSNRANQTEKSNQVSISGDLEGVENARSRVRELIPLIFGFEPPITSQNVDNNSSYVQKIQEQYKVQVMFKTRSKLHATIVLVKGVEWEVDQVKQATLHLMEYMCENLASQINVQMSIQISPQHHQIVLGKNHTNLKAIMQYTNCQIIFPDAQDQNIPSLKKSNINISGNIHNVYTARQLLIGCLPLLIIFDLPEDLTNLKIKPEEIAEIQSTYDVIINIRQKTKQIIKACIIKGIEKYADNIYKARNALLGVDDTPITADIPPTYHIPNVPSSLPTFQQNELLTTPTNLNPNPLSPLVSPLFNPLFSTTWQYPGTGPSPMHPINTQQAPPFVGLIQKPHFLFNFMQHSPGSSGFQSNTSSMSSEYSRENSLLSSISSNNSNMSSFIPSPRSTSGMQHTMEQSLFSEGNNSGNNHQQDKKSLYDYENKRLAGLRVMQSKPNPNIYRYPTNSWSGYGISHTSPANFPTEKINNGKKHDDDVWKSPVAGATNSNREYHNFPSTSSTNNNGGGAVAAGTATLNTSNILDHTPAHILNRLTSSSASSWTDLPTLLHSLGLERYIGLFVKHEIDLATFSTLSDKDLMEIGITAFGSRRKILLAISELNKRTSPFQMAPGAERKSSSSTPSSTSSHGTNSNNW